MDISGLSLGFLGCGYAVVNYAMPTNLLLLCNHSKISSAVARGYAIGTGTTRPAKIYVSPRTLEKAKSLHEAFPDLVVICESNEAVVENSNVVFIGLLPNIAAEILCKMPFRDDQTVNI